MNWMLMPFRRYVDFNGRSRRMEFWMWQLGLFIVNMIITVIMVIFLISAFASIAQSATSYGSGYGSRSEREAAQMAAVFGSMGIGFIILWIISLIFGLATFLPNLAVTIRRLHDTNRTGWWVLAPIGAYFFGIIFALAMALAVAGTSDGQGAGAVAAIAGIVYLLSMLVALGFFITLVVFCFLDGTRGPNRFGPDPKAGERGYEQTFG